MDRLILTKLPSPVGLLHAVTRSGKLCDLEVAEIWPDKEQRLNKRFGTPCRFETGECGEVAARLAAYFRGDLPALDGIDVDPGGTEFQREVWSALRRIPVGATLTYGAMAAQLVKPRAFRAVGAANGRNPVAIVIPCHRLIGANGSLTGYLSGIERKRWLLVHEGALAQTAQSGNSSIQA